MAVKVQVTLSDSVHERLNTLAKEQAIPLVQVIRKYLSRGEWLQEISEDPKKELLIKEDNETQKVIQY